jgi:hypothetical protein
MRLTLWPSQISCDSCLPTGQTSKSMFSVRAVQEPMVTERGGGAEHSDIKEQKPQAVVTKWMSGNE